MKSFSVFSCALALFAIFNIANADMCTPMDPKMKATYEKVYNTEFMGCSITAGEGMTAMGRINWLTPEGSAPLVEMDTSAMSELDGMSKIKGGSMMMAAVKVAGASASRPGYLTVGPECAASLPPDFVYSALAKSSSPKVFNALLEAECDDPTVRSLNTSTRMDDEDEDLSLAVAIVCLIASVLGIFFPAFDTALIDILKGIIETVFPLLPVVSVAARAI